MNCRDFDIQKIDNIFAIIVCFSSAVRTSLTFQQGAGVLGAILFISLPFLRCHAYEVFLRAHQGLAGLLLYATWQHLSSHHSTSRLFLIIIFGVFLLMLVIQVLHLLYRNSIFSSRGRPRALVARLSNEDKNGQDDEKQEDVEKKANQAKKEKATGPVSVLVNLSRPMKLDAGQYIYLSLPSLTFWSWLQSHPFTVISWSNEEQDKLELFVQPQRGFTADLLRAAEDGPVSFPAYITGPHGISEPVDQYESVLAIATDFGVAAVIPYFKKLIDNRNKSVARARRLHFVWQVQTRGMMRAIEYDHKANIFRHCNRRAVIA
jgi:hypothetical protein